MKEYSIEEFSEKLASKAPIPGGGGASAYVASLAAALGSMVANLTIGKKAYEGVEREMKSLLSEAEVLRKEALDLVEQDAIAFEPLSKAYKLPDNDPGKDQAMEECLKKAAIVPMDILRLSCKVILLSKEFEEKGSAIMASDAACCSIFAWAAMYGAAINVKVNTKLMKNRAYAEAMNNEVDELMTSHWKIADEVYEKVYKKLS